MKQKYVIVLEQSPRNWSAYVPDVPGCIATARTRRGVERVIKQAIEFHLEGLLEDGDPMPQPGTWTSVVEVNVPESGAAADDAGGQPPRKRASA